MGEVRVGQSYVRREEREGIVAPVVAQTLLDEMAFVHMVVDRESLHGRHSSKKSLTSTNFDRVQRIPE